MKDHITNNKSWKRNLIIILIIINLSIFSNNKLEKQKKLNEITEISIIVNGTGNQSIFNGKPFSSHQFNDIPTFIFINDVLQNYAGLVAYNLEELENNITIIWIIY